MKLIYAALLATAFALPALAEGADPFTSGDSGGPRHPRTTAGVIDAGYGCGPECQRDVQDALSVFLVTENDSADDYVPHKRYVKPAPAPSWEDDRTWVNYAASPKAGPVSDAGDLATQQKRNTEHARRTYEDVRDNGGCNADFIPADIAMYCGGSAFPSMTPGKSND